MRLGIYGTGGSGREVFDMIEMNPSLKNVGMKLYL